MSDYGHYVTYRNDTDQLIERVERTEHIRRPGRSNRPTRRALARGLHSIADRIDG